MAKVVVVSEKSAVLGFIINLLGLGFFGFDRFYKGDFILGTFKLIGGVVFFMGWIFVYPYLMKVEETPWWGYCAYVYAFLAVCDFILVPLGIIKDNAKKRAKLAMS
ncbi:Uncharacterised protein [Helicobacter cinaedi]|uniref:TM2 domain-containing protein n=1 Tax=Helicobacter cinaedi TaxID=213 RepID=A0A377JV34_9HELI|nr:TM2 domain-containing protein [Helicobacter cinaedi]STP11756.1 Uncharacterised protein [Helicobacter cinaedi]